MIEENEELSDYRVVLSCIRKRLEKYGMIEALEQLERLDDALLQAIVAGVSAGGPVTIN